MHLICIHAGWDTSWKGLEDIFARRLEDALKMFWRRLGIRLKDILKISWRRLKTFDQDEYIGLDKDVFERLEDVCWRCINKGNIIALIKTSWRHLGDDFWRSRWKKSWLIMAKTLLSRMVRSIFAMEAVAIVTILKLLMYQIEDFLIFID